VPGFLKLGIKLQSVKRPKNIEARKGPSSKNVGSTYAYPPRDETRKTLHLPETPEATPTSFFTPKILIYVSNFFLNVASQCHETTVNSIQGYGLNINRAEQGCQIYQGCQIFLGRNMPKWEKYTKRP
jgi:hypothetical protein